MVEEPAQEGGEGGDTLSHFTHCYSPTSCCPASTAPLATAPLHVISFEGVVDRPSTSPIVFVATRGL